MQAALTALLPVIGDFAKAFLLSPVYKWLAIILAVVVAILGYKLYKATHGVA